MATSTELVTAFLDMWEKPGGLHESIRAYFLDSTVWENVGMATTTGVAEAIGFMESFTASSGMATIRVELLGIAASGGKVLTERIDHVYDERGEYVMPIPVMGAFDIADDRIAAWRDYFDTASLQ